MGERECGLRTGNERVSLVEGECENCCMNLCANVWVQYKATTPTFFKSCPR